jgi:hypothetical protein
MHHSSWQRVAALTCLLHLLLLLLLAASVTTFEAMPV